MVELIPRQVLFGNPERVSPYISPDGGRLAWVAPHEGVLNVWVAPTSAEAGVDWAAARVVTDDTDRGIRMFAWAHDARHLLYLQDSGGDENWRLHDVDLETMQRRDLTPFDGVQARVVAMEREFPNEVLIGLNRDRAELHDVYRLDLVTGELSKEVDNPGFIGWLADAQLVVRGTVAPQPDGSLVLLVRDTPDADWRPLLTIPADDALTSDPIAFSQDGTSLLGTSSVGAQTGRLVRVSTGSGAVEVLAEDTQADVSGVRVHPDTREPQIVAFQKDRSEYLVLDPSVADDLTAIRALHPGDPVFIGADDADATWLVAFTNDSGPIPYFAYDRASRTGRFLFENRPALSRYELSSMEPFSFTARDGLTIRGYVTFPPGADRSGLPAVLNVHGGPWTRDVWGFDPEAQWLANRGYLCVQVNYRGSTGYGKAFVNAGDREWGGRMQDDLVDAVAFITGQGWADPGRVAIYGGSYGGYAALAGAAFTPDLFCCAVDIVGPSNLKTLIETIPPYWAPMIAQFHRRVGDPEKDAEFLWSRSPLSRVSDIRIPLLIAQGANDPRVKQAESEQIVAALEEAGIDHEYMLFPDEGHGFAKPENRLRFYAAAEQFLARHLGGRAE
ncbi:MAG TPA: S9 family peptidase [Streptosporangiaceae bacterium]|jgi:dipeptidyl aminopeptidase/acylaminoacyl peptidase|nr:S9 family peptidase [Streptosporangiaceae bacterium]